MREYCVDVILDRCNQSEVKNRQPDAGLPELDTLFDTAHTQHVHQRLFLDEPADSIRAVSVGIGLDGHHDTAFGAGLNELDVVMDG